MSEQLVTLIIAPGTAWFLALFVLLLGVLEWGDLIHFRLRTVRRQLDAALRGLDASPEEPEAFAAVFRPLSAQWEEIPFLRLTWRAFRGTVVTPTPGGGMRALARATTFFDPEVMLPIALPLRRLRAVPYFLLGTGGMATLVMLLTTLLVYLRGATPGDGAALQAVLAGLGQHLPLQLLPLAMGIFVAVWIGLESRRHLAGIEARIHHFAHGVETRIGYLADASLLVDPLRDAGAGVAATLPADLSERLVDALRGLLDEYRAIPGSNRELEGAWLRTLQEILKPVVDHLGRNTARWERLLDLLERGNAARDESLERLDHRLGEMQQRTAARSGDQALVTAVDTLGGRLDAALREQGERVIQRQEQGERRRSDLHATLVAFAQASQGQSERLAQLLDGVRASLEQVRLTLQSGSSAQQGTLHAQWQQLRTLVQEMVLEMHQGLERQQERVLPTLTRFATALDALETRQARRDQALQSTLLEGVAASMRHEGAQWAERQGRDLQQALDQMQRRIAALTPHDADHLHALADKLERILVLLATRGGEVSGLSLEPVIAWVREESSRMAERHEAVIRKALAAWQAALPDQDGQKGEIASYMQRMERAAHKLEEGVDLLTSIGDIGPRTLPAPETGQAVVDGMQALQRLLDGVRELQHLHTDLLGSLTPATEQVLREGLAGFEQQVRENQTQLWAENNQKVTDTLQSLLARFDGQLAARLDDAREQQTRTLREGLQEGLREQSVQPLVLDEAVVDRLREGVASDLQEQTRTLQESLREGVASDLQAQTRTLQESLREGVASDLQAQTKALQTTLREGVASDLQAQTRTLQESLREGVASDLQAQTRTLQESLREGLQAQAARPVLLAAESMTRLAEQVRGEVPRLAEDLLLTLMTLFQEQMEKGEERQREALRAMLAPVASALEGISSRGLEEPVRETLTWLRTALAHNDGAAARELLERIGQMAQRIEHTYLAEEQTRREVFEVAMTDLAERVDAMVDGRLNAVRIALEEMRDGADRTLFLANQELMDRVSDLADRIEEVQEDSNGIRVNLAALDEPFIQLAEAIRGSITGMEQTQDAVFFFTEKFPELLASYLEAIEEEGQRQTVARSQTVIGALETRRGHAS
ncbi:MAG: hypothetical protein HQL66_04645 [Magnetococcales bacterium]|nr:hypothetical protein [Magnetococcales bacterium]